MPDYQPIDYRLRCHTKRTDLPADVLRDIGEAYAEIGRLQRERDEARLEVCGLHHLTGFLAGDYANSRGWDCFKDHPRGLEFPPSVTDFKLFLDGQEKIFLEWIDRLTEERDEARREVCRDEAYRPSPSPPCTANQVADRRGWDCFKENTDG